MAISITSLVIAGAGAGSVGADRSASPGCRQSQQLLSTLSGRFFLLAIKVGRTHLYYSVPLVHKRSIPYIFPSACGTDPRRAIVIFTLQDWHSETLKHYASQSMILQGYIDRSACQSPALTAKRNTQASQRRRRISGSLLEAKIAHARW